ncbi:hypothetical protein TTHERM_001055482 (macronuclear) [Tetrahymena thermophila SB210]|uniref:Uncharacterized protein n=1 Tax=Tetrahymena thermophila (strain SB210) TaxID=312017 RepID=W7XBJ3_TETTS|nr:hypothetical protein TTHERM_001055482 [Tetrahymena thermophila SB210]EWS71046.1 hypothetical protein TTHERM_001055482 [Tetrahymena thermophila SB210]|eukprot:XP_012656412.1 hypothetical protein TTHERM_001055482 [Tetrahymena thermophila SB210]
MPQNIFFEFSISFSTSEEYNDFFWFYVLLFFIGSENNFQLQLDELSIFSLLFFWIFAQSSYFDCYARLKCCYFSNKSVKIKSPSYFFRLSSFRIQFSFDLTFDTSSNLFYFINFNNYYIWSF